jgi:D-alanyl-D-alanine carboxypeptidase/D-alanyl-D-alanine-endopeptidase (penicillin-binding protein 4)
VVAVVAAVQAGAAAPVTPGPGAITASAMPAPAMAPSASTTTTPSPTSTSTSSTTTTLPVTTTTLAPGPAGFADTMRTALADPRFEHATVGLAVWVEGDGMVVNHNADVALRPGSNEKLLVAWAAYGAIGPDTTLTTEVRLDADDLVLVGGGDPSLRSTGPHSLDRLAARVRAQGVTEVAGDLVADESRFDAARRAPGWTERHVPLFVGPVSALAVDGNALRSDPEYVADPAAGNLAEFRAALGRHGVTVAGVERRGTAPEAAPVLASVDSAPVSQLVRSMLTTSDNFAAEMLLKEAGWRARGLGTWENGVAAVRDLAAGAGVALTGRAADGSGLSRDDSRPAREWAELLVAARDQPWFGHLIVGLPLAGRTGTLANRFLGTAGEANVRAKTGSVRESRSLSGYVTTAGGRQVVFSLVVNASPLPPGVLGAIDGVVSSMAGSGA